MTDEEKERKSRNIGIGLTGAGAISLGLSIPIDKKLKKDPDFFWRNKVFEGTKKEVLDRVTNTSRTLKKGSIPLFLSGGSLIGYSAYKHYKNKEKDDNSKKK